MKVASFGSVIAVHMETATLLFAVQANDEGSVKQSKDALRDYLALLKRKLPTRFLTMETQKECY